MINISNEFKQELYNDNRKYLAYADITLKDGTELSLTNEQIWNDGLSIEDAVSSENSFDIGSAIINQCTLTINNCYDDFSEYDFTDAEVIVYIGLELPSGRIERIRKGTFAVNEAKYNGMLITLSSLDNMRKFDRPYSESKLPYPATLNQIVRDACSVCGVTLQTYNFPHYTFVVQTRPNDEATTFREVISWCAQIACCFCRCDTLGRLELKWYNQGALEKNDLDGGIFDAVNANKYTTGDNVDGGSFSPWSTGYVADGGSFGDRDDIHYIYSTYSLDISTDDVVITGVKVIEKNKEENQDALTTYQSGSEGYIVSIENNELIKNGAGQTVAGWIGEQLIGFRFRKAGVAHASDPTIEAGDVGFLTDRKQNVYRIVISSTKFSTGNSQNTVSSAQTPARNSAKRFSAETKNYVELRKDIQQEKTNREKALEELQVRIDNSSGLFTTEVTQPDGSTIFYMHDKPTLAESKIVWKMTAEAFAVSTDGGKTYNAGLTVDGDLIARILSVVGVNCDWIHSGTLTLGGDNNDDGVLVVYNKSKKEIIRLDNSGITVSEGKIIGPVIGGTGYESFNSSLGYTGIKFERGRLWFGFSGYAGGTTATGHTFDDVVWDSFFRPLRGGVDLACSIEGAANILGKRGFMVELISNTDGNALGYSRAHTNYAAFSVTQSTVDPPFGPSGNDLDLRYKYCDTIIRGRLIFNPISCVPSDELIDLYNNNNIEEQSRFGILWSKSAGSSVNIDDRYGIFPIVSSMGYANSVVSGTGIIGGLRVYGGIYSYNTLISGGSKSRLVETDNYGSQLQYCYEMASPMFGDIGGGILDSDGECIIYLDDKFLETCYGTNYYVFLQKEGMGDVYVSSKASSFFIVKGTPNLKFAWEIKMKQKDLENERMGHFENIMTNREKSTDLSELYLNEMNMEEYYYGIYQENN